MFVEEPIAAVREAARVAKPGGRYAVMTWDRRSANPWLALIGALAADRFAFDERDPKALLVQPGDGDFHLRPGAGHYGVVASPDGVLPEFVKCEPPRYAAQQES